MLDISKCDKQDVLSGPFNCSLLGCAFGSLLKLLALDVREKSPFAPEEEEKKRRRILRAHATAGGSKKGMRMMMRSGLIRGQADANDVSPSGKLMLKYGPG